MRVCDWRQCTREAETEVRCDVPRGGAFTSLMWWRCGVHTPPLRPGTKLTTLATGDVVSMWGDAR